MKKFILATALLGSILQVNAKKIKIGGKGGFLTFSSTSTQVLPGDTIAVAPGVYTGFSFSNLKGSATNKIIILNDNGLVEIKGTNSSSMQNTTNVVLTGTGARGIQYGFYFHDITGRGIEFKGKMDSTAFSNLKFERVSDYALFMSNTVVYNGASTTMIRNMKLLNLWFKKTGTPFNCGNYGSVKDMMSVVRDVEVAYCRVDSIQTGDVFRFYKGFDVNVHHNIITNVGLNVTTHNGVVYLKGDGAVHHNYFKNVWGNCIRASGVGLNEVGDIYFYNNLCLGSRKYSGVELRTLPEDTSDTKVFPYTTKCNYYVYNNTIGNQTALIGTPAGNVIRAVMVDVYDFFGAKCVIKNNLGFNVEKDRAYEPSRNYIYALQKPNKPDTSNNIYRRNYVDLGLKDTIDCMLTSKSIAIDKGLVFSTVTDDYSGIRRPLGRNPDVGAREYDIATSMDEIDLFEKKELTVYPNPASKEMRVEYEKPMGKVTITDQEGKLIESRSAQGSSFDLDILNLSHGMYHISVETEDGTLSKSFIKN